MNSRKREPRHPTWTKDLRGLHNRPLCCVCLTEVSGRRQTFCSDDCVLRYKLATGNSSWVRAAVRKRDKGVCALCGLDTYWLRRELPLRAIVFAAQMSTKYGHRLAERLEAAGLLCAISWWTQEQHRWRLVAVRMLTMLGWSIRISAQLCAPPTGYFRKKKPTQLQGAFWHADHIVPLCDGGAAALDNLRTLCCRCHANVTAEQARIRNKKELP